MWNPTALELQLLRIQAEMRAHAIIESIGRPRDYTHEERKHIQDYWASHMGAP